MRHAWTIYNPTCRVSDLRLFDSKKKAQAEFDRIYSGGIGRLINEYAPEVRVVKVTFDL